MGRRSKIALNSPPEISRRIFWCNQNFWKRNFQHPMKPEVDRKWRNAVVQLVINTMENLLMYFFEYCESDCNCFYVLVTRVTNMDATLNRKIMDATVKWTFFAQISVQFALTVHSRPPLEIVHSGRQAMCKCTLACWIHSYPRAILGWVHPEARYNC